MVKSRIEIIQMNFCVLNPCTLVVNIPVSTQNINTAWGMDSPAEQLQEDSMPDVPSGHGLRKTENYFVVTVLCVEDSTRLVNILLRATQLLFNTRRRSTPISTDNWSDSRAEVEVQIVSLPISSPAPETSEVHLSDCSDSTNDPIVGVFQQPADPPAHPGH